MNIPILNLRVAPFVECSNCNALCEYGKQTKCWACSADVVVDDDSLFSLCLVNTGSHTPYTPYVKCPNCSRLLRVGVTNCPDCREELSMEYSLVNAYSEVLKTIACDNARTIASFNPYAAIVVVVSVAVFAVEVVTREVGVSYIIPFMSISPLLFVLIWFYRFGAIDDTDKEYLYAKGEAKRSLKRWLLILAAQVFVVFLLIFPH